MSADPLAFKALGLEPGADWPAIESAYRTLIKRHHPDRQGGDAKRAAEVNWAYHQLRRARSSPTPDRRPARSLVPLRPAPRARRGRGWIALLLVAGIAAAVLLREDGLGSATDDLSLPVFEPAGLMPSGFGAPPAQEAPMLGDAAGPLDTDAIDRSILDATRLVREGGRDRLARQSRRCHSELQSRPAMSRFDQCVAFDEAAVALLGGAALDAAGQFGPSAITGRQIAAGRRVSGDYMAVDSRVARIRSQVAFTLAPPDPRTAPVEF